MQQQQREIHQPMPPSVMPPQVSMPPPLPPPPPPPPPPVNPPGKKSSVEWDIFTSLKGNATPIKSICLYNQMLMQLGSDLKAEWKALGRMLSVSESDLYAIKANDVHVVEEQGVLMFEHWVKKNGAGATVGVLVTAVYKSGPQYWNLLKIINEYIPGH